MKDKPKIKEKCQLCGWEWERKNPEKKPRSCPNCKRYDYSKPQPSK